MNNFDPAKTVLLVLAVLMLMKSIWGAAHPVSMKRAGLWWSGAAMQVNTLLGLFYLILAVVTWISVLIDQSMTNRILVIFGALFVWVGILAFKPQEFRDFIKKMVGDRSAATIRIISIFTAVIALLLIWIAHKGI